MAIINVFEHRTSSNKLSARRKFYTVTIEKHEKLLTYLNRAKQLATIMQSINVDIDDQELAIAAVVGLLVYYEGFIAALDPLIID